MIPDKTQHTLSSLIGCDGSPLLRPGMTDSRALESRLYEDELCGDEEADMSLLQHDVLQLHTDILGFIKIHYYTIF